MLKTIKIVIALAVTILCFQTSAYAQKKPLWYGIEQRYFKGRNSANIPIYFVESSCNWNGQGENRSLMLIAARSAVAKGWDVPADAVAVAASVLDFTTVNPEGINCDYLGTIVTKERAGRIFKDTTDPILRVEYSDISYPNKKLYKTLGTKTGYGRDALLNLGLSPGTCKILRFAVIVKPIINKVIDDFGLATVSKMQYHRFPDSSREINNPVDISLEVRLDEGRDPLLASFNSF